MRYWKEIALGICIIGLVLSIRSCREKEKMAQSVVQAKEALSSDLNSKIDRQGVEIASKESVIADNEKQLKKILEANGAQAAAISRLLKQKGKVISGALVTTETEQESSSPTVKDTVDAVVIYTGSYQDEYLAWEGRATPDSFNVDIRVTNEFELTQASRNPWFKKRVTKANLKNLNPYTRTTELQSFLIDEPSKRIGLGPYVGASLGPDLTVRPQIGVGVSYDIIQIK